MICERCSREVYFLEKCNYCGRKLGRECFKSQKRIHKVDRIVICKDCWSKLDSRRLFKAL